MISQFTYVCLDIDTIPKPFIEAVVHGSATNIKMPQTEIL